MKQDLIKIFFLTGFKNSLNNIFNSIFNTNVLVDSMKASNDTIANYTVQGELPDEEMVTIVNGGSEFAVQDTIQVYSNDDSLGGVLTVDSVDNDGKILSVSVTTPGTGYSEGDVIFGTTFGNGSSAVFQVGTVDGNGGITSVSIVADGHDYKVDDTITIVPKKGTGAIYYVTAIENDVTTIENGVVVTRDGVVTQVQRKYGGMLYNSGSFSQVDSTLQTNNFGTDLVFLIPSENILYNQSVTLFTITYEMEKLNTINSGLLRQLNSTVTADRYKTSLLSNLPTVSTNWVTIMTRAVDNLALSIANTVQEDGQDALETNTSSASLNKTMLNSLDENYYDELLMKMAALNNYAAFMINASNGWFQFMSWQKYTPIRMFLSNELTTYINVVRTTANSITDFCSEFQYLLTLQQQGTYNVELDSIPFQNQKTSVLESCEALNVATTVLLNAL